MVTVVKQLPVCQRRASVAVHRSLRVTQIGASPALTPDVLRRIYAKGVRHGATSRQDGGIIDKANPTDGGFDGQLQSRN